MKKITKFLFFGFILLALQACGAFSGKKPIEQTMVIEKYSNDLELEKVPGTVHGPWAEAMYQDVDVPGAIDPKGVYYRLPHRTIVEIRQEKYQRAQYPDRDGVYRERE